MPFRRIPREIFQLMRIVLQIEQQRTVDLGETYEFPAIVAHNPLRVHIGEKNGFGNPSLLPGGSPALGSAVDPRQCRRADQFADGRKDVV